MEEYFTHVLSFSKTNDNYFLYELNFYFYILVFEKIIHTLEINIRKINHYPIHIFISIVYEIERDVLS